MQQIVVALFDARPQADAARASLLGQGFHDRQIVVEGGDAPDAKVDRSAVAAPEGGLAGVIGRMFSGFATDPQRDVHDYAEFVARGGVLLAVYGLDDDALARASSLLRAGGARDVQPHGSAREDASREDARDAHAEARAERELAAVSSVGGPQVYALPNAPVGWSRTGGSVMAARMVEDPAQPKGELSGSSDLAPQADRDMLEQRRRRSQKKTRR